MDSAPQRERSRQSRLAGSILLLGGALALFVGFVSPDRRSILCLAGGWVAIALLIGLQRIGSRSHWLTIRLDPRIALLLTTLCVCVAISELSLRFFFTAALPDWNRKEGTSFEPLGFQPDRRLGWSPIPGDQRLLKAGHRMIAISHNSDGFRDTEPALDARPRIVFIGDSFLWGTGLEAEERFTNKLRVRHSEWGIYNFGVVGYGNDQEYLLLQSHFEKYHPQAVFLLFCTENDFADNGGNGGGIQIFKPYFTADHGGLRLHGIPVPLPDYIFCQKHPFLSKLYLVRLVMRAWGNLRCPPVHIFQRDITFQVLEAVHKYVSAHGAKFYVGFTNPEPELERFLERSAIPHIDLSTDLRQEGDFHWSAAGNSAAADKIEGFLKEQNFGKARAESR